MLDTTAFGIFGKGPQSQAEKNNTLIEANYKFFKPNCDFVKEISEISSMFVVYMWISF